MKRMKKNKAGMLAAFFFLGFLSVYGQKLQSYVQAEGGISIENKNTWRTGLEFGETYKWLDFGLAIDYESNWFWNDYRGEVLIYKDVPYNPAEHYNDNFGYFSHISLQLTAKLNVIRFFRPDSRHALKIGGGLGPTRINRSVSHTYDETSDYQYTLETSSYSVLFGSVKISYEYEIKPKIKLGAFVGGTYCPYCGLVIRRDF